MTPAVLDHLWQSTLAALGVALLTLAFRRAGAGVRYGLWFAASVKFLVPFAALALLGRALAPTVRFPVHATPEAVFMARATQPFSQASLSKFPLSQSPLAQAPLSPAYALAPSPHAAPHLDLALILAIVWALGCIAVLIAWTVRSASVRSAVRSATPLPWNAPMPVLASSSLMEPGLVGLWRPVLLVPKSLPEHLSQPEIDAILAHEACHLRRRDNLTAAVHMLVEALFWFHPLVWWIGARLIEERERACDEAVVQAGHERAAYARSLVESCRLYLQSPLPCVAGASGSNLKTRVEAIMTAPLASPLSPAKKALLLAVGLCAFATPVAAGLLTSPAGQQAVAHAAAVAAGFAPVRLEGARAAGPTSAVPSAPQESAPEKGAAPAIAPVQSETSSPADVSVAAIEAPPPAPAQDGPTRLAALAPLPSVAQTLQSAPAQTILPAAPAAQAAEPADLFKQASSFVHSYPAFTPRRLIAHWAQNPICIRIVGLAPDQEAAVRARIMAVAKVAAQGEQQSPIAGVRTFWFPTGCQKSNVEIGFTTDPQRMLDDVSAREGRLPLRGDATSGANTVKIVARPIQAWYMTYDARYAYDARDLGPPCAGGLCRSPDPQPRSFDNIMVIVDLRQTGTTIAGPITDYVAMLVLSEPRSLDRCNALPSVTDLFAGVCPGRGAPDGLTPADTAFLRALYASNDQVYADGQPSVVGERMAHILAMTKVAAR